MASFDLLDLLEREWREVWWAKLVQEQPQVALRLMAKFPEHYPVKTDYEKERFLNYILCIVIGLNILTI